MTVAQSLDRFVVLVDELTERPQLGYDVRQRFSIRWSSGIFTMWGD